MKTRKQTESTATRIALDIYQLLLDDPNALPPEFITGQRMNAEDVLAMENAGYTWNFEAGKWEEEQS